MSISQIRVQVNAIRLIAPFLESRTAKLLATQIAGTRAHVSTPRLCDPAMLALVATFLK